LNKDAFTARGIPWQVFLIIPNLHSKQAFLVEDHIKKMKSKTFILNLKKYPDLILNVVSKRYTYVATK
jgi:putative endonuclease